MLSLLKPKVKSRRDAAIPAIALLGGLLILGMPLRAQGPLLSVSPGNTIQTIAGNGAQFFSGDNGAATSAALAKPGNVAMDSSGNLYIADADNHRVRMVDTTGKISTFAGNGVQGFLGDGGSATLASLNTPASVAVFGTTVYIADSRNNVIRAVSNGTITTVAGSSTGVAGYSGDGGSATSALLSCPRGIAVDTNGNLYIADTKNHVVREVVAGKISTIAGNGQQGFQGDNGPATAASLDTPSSVSIDPSGNVLIADTRNQRIRQVSGGKLTTIAGNGALGFLGEGVSALNAAFDHPLGVAADGQGNFFVADSNNQRIRKVDSTGTITTVVGNGQEAFLGDSSAPLIASLDTPTAVLPMNGQLVITDKDNERVRVVNPATIPLGAQIVGTTGSPQAITFTNAGGGTLTLNSFALSAGDFAVASGGSCGSTFPVNLTAGANCTELVVFSPTVVGPRSATMQVTDNAPTSTQSFSLVGEGTQDTTQLSLSSSQSASTYGGSVTLTATISPGTPTTTALPTGTVSFTDGTTSLATSQVTSGTAAFSSSTLSAGTHTINATFSGDSNYSGSFGSFAQVVNKAVPTVALTVQPNPVVPSQPATLTATLTSSRGVPTGTVLFTDGGTSLGTSPVNSSGIATLMVPFTGGSHSLLAEYNGDSNFVSSFSATVNLQIAGFSISSQPSSATIRTGQQASFTISIVAPASFTSSLSLSCLNLPAFSSCSFSPSTVRPTGGAATTALTFGTSGNGMNAVTSTPTLPSTWMFILFGILLVGQCCLRWTQRFSQPRWVTACALLTIIFLGIGCSKGPSSGSGSGSGSGPGPSQTTPPGTYSISVMASTGGTGSQSATVPLTITVTP